MKIAWITVNYNQEEFLKDWYFSIFQQSVTAAYDIFVVDNSDTCLSADDNIQLFRPKDNLGYFGGFNYCIDRIDPTKYDAVVFSNPDVTFSPDFIKLLQQTPSIKSNDRAMIIAPRITLDSGIEQNPNVANSVSYLRKAYYELMFSSYYCFLVLGVLSKFLKRFRPKKFVEINSKTIYMAHGACFIATPEFFNKCGRLDQRIFLWGEEALLMNQVTQNGGEIWFEPSVRVFHHEHTATGKIASKIRFDMMKKSFHIYRDFL